MNTFRAFLLASASAYAPLPALAQTAQSNPPAPLFATVDGTQITAAEYYTGAREMFNSRFFHRTPPEAERQEVLREFGQTLIDRILLEKEAARRGIKADAKSVQAELDQLDQRYGSSAQWQQQREATLPNLRAHLERQSQRTVLETNVRNVAKPAPAEVKAYFDKNPQLFTEPEKLKASLILLPVDPSSPSSVWDKTQKDAMTLRDEILAGASFEEMARKRSRDPSAASGGDLGYLHAGTLAPEVQGVLDKLQPGAIGEPVRALQGYMILRLVERQQARLMAFADVQERASDLLRRERGNAAWDALVKKLRSSAKVVYAPEFSELMAQASAK